MRKLMKSNVLPERSSEGSSERSSEGSGPALTKQFRALDDEVLR